MAVLCHKRVSSYGENTLRCIHDCGEGDHGEENEGSGGHHHIPGVQNDRNGEEDVGEHPAAKCCPVEQLQLSCLNFCFYLKYLMGLATYHSTRLK